MEYKHLAKYYDALVYDEDATKKWVDFTLEYCSGSEILEVASGSGDVAASLIQHGKKVLATDLSEDIGKQLQSKYPKIPFQIMNMTDIQGDNLWDGILCYCDSVNYLKNLDEVKCFFKGVRKRLKEEGVFLFDVHAMDRLEEFDEMFIEEGVALGTPYQWTIIRKDFELHYHFVFYSEDRVIQETYIQQVFTPQEIEQCLKEAGFTFTVKTDFILDGYVPGEKYFYICKGDKR